MIVGGSQSSALSRDQVERWTSLKVVKLAACIGDRPQRRLLQLTVVDRVKFRVRDVPMRDIQLQTLLPLLRWAKPLYRAVPAKQIVVEV